MKEFNETLFAHPSCVQQAPKKTAGVDLADPSAFRGARHRVNGLASDPDVTGTCDNVTERGLALLREPEPTYPTCLREVRFDF